jgi:hypothetical protein
MTGYFQQLLPDVYKKITTLAQQSISRAGWEGNINQLGVRSVQLLSYKKPGLKAYKEKLAREREEQRAAKKQAAFVVFPDPESVRKEERRAQRLKEALYDPDADEEVANYLQPREIPGAVSFTAVVLLSDRSDWLGGEMLVTKKRHVRDAVRTDALGGGSTGGGSTSTSGDVVSEGEDGSGVEEDDDEEDKDKNEDWEDEEEEEDAEEHPKRAKRGAKGGEETDEDEEEDEEFKHLPKFTRFNAEETDITRFTPELGNMLLIKGDHGRGTRPILSGKRHALVVEFWPFQDAASGSTRPAFHEGIPLPRSSSSSSPSGHSEL